jgi:hypothetical protein
VPQQGEEGAVRRGREHGLLVALQAPAGKKQGRRRASCQPGWRGARARARRTGPSMRPAPSAAGSPPGRCPPAARSSSARTRLRGRRACHSEARGACAPGSTSAPRTNKVACVCTRVRHHGRRQRPHPPVRKLPLLVRCGAHQRRPAAATAAAANATFNASIVLQNSRERRPREAQCARRLVRVKHLSN